MMGYGWNMGPLGWIVMALFWIVIIGLVVWALVALIPRARGNDTGRADSPAQILDRRFALGEIDTEQYRAARAQLTADPNTPR
jgi:putative membrane protein